MDTRAAAGGAARWWAGDWIPFASLTPERAVLRVSLATAVVAAAIVVQLAPQFAELDAERVLLFVGLLAVARLATLEMFDRSSYSVAAVPTLAAGMLMG